MKTIKIRSYLPTVAFLLCFICSATQTTLAIENEVWISPIGPADTSASGTPSDPFRCPDPSSLDTVLTTVLTNNYLTIHLMGGTFEVSTNGIKTRTGWKLRGAGIDNTIVQLCATNIFATNPGKFDVVGGADAGVTADGVEVSDLTVDCNFQNTSGVSDLAAVTLAGSNTRISRIKAINWGTVTSGYECFVLGIDPSGEVNAYGTDATNCIIEDCIVTQPASVTFEDGATCIGISTWDSGYGRTNHIKNAIIRDNLVTEIQTGGGSAMPVYCNAYGVGAVISHNQANDITGDGAHGVYADTGNLQDLVIEDNIINNVTFCIYFNMTSYNVIGLDIKNNVCRPAEGGRGIEYYGGVNNSNTNAFVNKFVINNNVGTSAKRGFAWLI